MFETAKLGRLSSLENIRIWLGTMEIGQQSWGLVWFAIALWCFMISYKTIWIRVWHYDPHPRRTTWPQEALVTLRLASPRPETERLRIQNERMRILFLGAAKRLECLGFPWPSQRVASEFGFAWKCGIPHMDMMINHDKPVVLRCFKVTLFSNKAIWDQGAHSLWCL